MIGPLLEILPYLIPLALLSTYSLGLILHKASRLRTCRALSDERFASVLERSFRREPVSDLPLKHPLAFLLLHRNDASSLLRARAQTILSQMEDRIAYFPALANISTLSGLFGTVMGMISAFFALRTGGGADPSSLAGGLGVALVATALGLITAIPSLVAHAVFQKQIQATSTQMETLLSVLLPEDPLA